MDPYVYISTRKAQDMRRAAPFGARVAIHFPEHGRAIELTADEHGRFTVTVGPDAVHGGEFVSVYHGSVTEAV